jgi:hypothetical protein
MGVSRKLVAAIRNGGRKILTLCNTIRKVYIHIQAQIRL